MPWVMTRVAALTGMDIESSYGRSAGWAGKFGEFLLVTVTWHRPDRVKGTHPADPPLHEFVFRLAGRHEPAEQIEVIRQFEGSIVAPALQDCSPVLLVQRQQIVKRGGLRNLAERLQALPRRIDDPVPARRAIVRSQHVIEVERRAV